MVRRLTRDEHEQTIKDVLELDDPDMLEPNGKTVLDNMTVVVGTEYG